MMQLCAHCHQPLPARVYRVGRLRLDTGTQRLYETNRRYRTGEREIKLSHSEFALIEILMRRPGTPFHRDILLDALTERASEQSLHTLMTKIRHKIGTAARIPDGRKQQGYSVYRIVA